LAGISNKKKEMIKKEEEIDTCTTHDKDNMIRQKKMNDFIFRGSTIAFSFLIQFFGGVVLRVRDVAVSYRSRVPLSIHTAAHFFSSSLFSRDIFVISGCVFVFLLLIFRDGGRFVRNGIQSFIHLRDCGSFRAKDKSRDIKPLPTYV
jgi:hypothetical protein